MVQLGRCFHCNRLMSYEGEVGLPITDSTKTRDHIFPKRVRNQFPRPITSYKKPLRERRKRANLLAGLSATVPSCRHCNEERGDKDFGEYSRNKQIGETK